MGLGHEGVGVVKATGPAVKQLKYASIIYRPSFSCGLTVSAESATVLDGDMLVLTSDPEHFIALLICYADP